MRVKALLLSLVLVLAVRGANPALNRILFAPTAYTLEKGEIVFSVYEVIFPSLTFGITDSFDVAGGMAFLPGISGFIDNFTMYYLAPKFRFYKTENLAISAGGLLVGVIGGGYEGFGYAVLTTGSVEKYFTVGLAMPFSGKETFSHMIMFLGGKLPLSSKFSLVGESYLITGLFTLISPGLRFSTGNLAVDLGVMYNIIGGGDKVPLPWFGFSYKFSI